MSNSKSQTAKYSRLDAAHLLLSGAQLTSDAEPWLSAMQFDVPADPLVGQDRPVAAVAQAQATSSPFSHAFLALPAGMIALDVVEALAEQQAWSSERMLDWVYLANPEDDCAPLCISLPPGTAQQALTDLWHFLETPVPERSSVLEILNERYKSLGYRHYLEQIQEKVFDDIPGSELATVIVSHEQPKAWVYCDRVTQSSLFGDIRIQNVEGQLNTELHLIRPGALLKANGGTLVINANELLTHGELWSFLKHILRTGWFTWQQPLSNMPAGSVLLHYEPEPIPIDLKVLLVGSRDLFTQLRELDREFDNFFPFLAEFSSFFPVHKFGPQPYAAFLRYLENKARSLPLSSTALHTFLNQSAEMTEHQNELSLDAIALIQLLEEANVWARKSGMQEINEHAMEQAIQARSERERLLAELNYQAILERQIIIDTEGEVIGQINGLTVVSMAGVEFGEPSRITATVHYGDGDIIDIERKSELGGNIHTKGIMILTAYLANLFARQEAMPLSATVVFEQSYHEVDGDSASLAELCCLISALSETPIDQRIAVTGAIDQFGNVQAIGGINEKIHGYFEICKLRGLTGMHGVIVPKSNIVNLHLNREIKTAVAAGQFSVYAVSHATQAFELLMGLPCGDSQDETQDSLFGRVKGRLEDALSHQHANESSWWQRLFK